MARILAVIGTAGRDKSKPMDASLWAAMCEDVRGRLRSHDELVSGGAAWADHLAVHAFLQGWCAALRLYLPAPLVQLKTQWQFDEVGPKSSGGAANWYHARFTQTVGSDTRGEIALAIARGALMHTEPARAGFGGMFARNQKVATACNAVLAYTFNAGAEPADGGTMDTWKQARSADRVHVDLGALAARRPAASQSPRDMAAIPPRCQRYR